MTRFAILAILPAISVFAIEARVVAEEEVYTYTNPNNGSGPMWSFGCTPVARVGDRVFVSEMETGEGVPRLCNTRWRLRERTAAGWKVVAETPEYKQREPTIITTNAKDQLFLYVNTSLMPPGTEYGPCEPHLLAFTLKDNPPVPVKYTPTWDGKTKYTDHSYRGYAADAVAQRILMFNIDAETSIQHFCLLTMDGNTIANGSVTFPVRACYPQVAVENNRAHILAVGDIVEPVEEWRKFKHDQTGQAWDYVFRRLFYARNEDAERGKFAEPIEIANVDATAGSISNQDLWIAPNGDAYIMYTELEVGSALMRDKFFPGKSTVPSLNLAIVRDGAIAERHVLMPRSDTEHTGHARFHVTANGDVFALLYISGPNPRNELIRIFPKVDAQNRVPVPFKAPFGSFLLANTRSGNAPSNTIDLVGPGANPNTMAYGQIVAE